MINETAARKVVAQIGEHERESFALLERRADLIERLNTLHDQTVLAHEPSYSQEVALRAAVYEALRSGGDYDRLNQEMREIDARRNQLQIAAEALRWELLLELVVATETAIPMNALLSRIPMKGFT